MSSQANNHPLVNNKFEYTEALLAFLQERCELLEALKTLADAQAAAAGLTEIDTTLGLLGRKQSLLEELADVQEKLQPYMADDPEQRMWSSPERRRQCQQIAEQGQQLLKATMQLEHQALEQMTSRRDAVAAQLQDGSDSILAHTAYMADSLLGDSTLDFGDL